MNPSPNQTPSLLARFDAFNQTLAEHVVGVVSTTWCTYAFIVLVIVPFFNDQLTSIVMFISSSLLQLVLLPIIMVGQKRQGDINEARAQADHQAICEMHQELLDIIKSINNLLNDYAKLGAMK